MSTCFPCDTTRIKNNANYFNFSRPRKFRQKIGDICTYYSDAGSFDATITNIDASVYNSNNSAGTVVLDHQVINSYEFAIQVDFSDTSLYPGDEFIVNIRLCLDNGDIKSNSFYVCATDSFNRTSNCNQKQNLYVLNGSNCSTDTTDSSTTTCNGVINSETPNILISSYETVSLPTLPDWVNFVGIKFDRAVNYQITSNGVVLNSGTIANSESILYLSRSEAINLTYGPTNSSDKVTATVYYLIERPTYYTN